MKSSLHKVVNSTSLLTVRISILSMQFKKSMSLKRVLELIHCSCSFLYGQGRGGWSFSKCTYFFFFLGSSLFQKTKHKCCFGEPKYGEADYNFQVPGGKEKFIVSARKYHVIFISECLCKKGHQFELYKDEHKMFGTQIWW